ncbi:MAG: hypothetical protein KIG57_08530 [Muribaculaceae bacterium]|nr:hypothetical protein [Muribaculaceae bacterium]
MKILIAGAWFGGVEKNKLPGGVGICGMEKNKNPASQKKNCASRIFDGVPLYAEELFFYFSQR